MEDQAPQGTHTQSTTTRGKRSQNEFFQAPSPQPTKILGENGAQGNYIWGVAIAVGSMLTHLIDRNQKMPLRVGKQSVAGLWNGLDALFAFFSWQALYYLTKMIKIISAKAVNLRL